MKSATFLLLLLLSATPLMTSACRGGAAVNQTIDDATITTRVKTALLNAPDVQATQIDVDTSAGVVTLKGVVKTKEEEAKALDVARRVTGVRDVKSELKIQ
jgi:hyperosmotically inducible protein